MSALAAQPHPLDGDDAVPIAEVAAEPQLTITVVPDGTTVTLQLDGILDLATVGTLRSCIDHIDPAARTVVVDLAGLTFIDSTGVSQFVLADRELGVGLRTLSVRNAGERVRFVFDITGLGDLLDGG